MLTVGSAFRLVLLNFEIIIMRLNNVRDTRSEANIGPHAITGQDE